MSSLLRYIYVIMVFTVCRYLNALFQYTIQSLVLIPAGRYKYLYLLFGSTYIKIGTIQRRLAWPLRKDDTQIREAFHIFLLFKKIGIGIGMKLE